MAEINKIPEIRFKEFRDEWNQQQLSELADFSKGNGYSKKDLVPSGIPIILYGRLYTKYQVIIDKVDTFALAHYGSVLSTGNEVIVPASGETSEDIARASAVLISGVLLGGDLNIIYPKDKINSVFLALLISNGKAQKELSKKAQGKSVVHLRNPDIKELVLIYPKIKEQSKIGNYFSHLDNLISLSQKKYDKLITIKKAMLEKMFPKKGADVPEIRFKGFSGAWEEKTFSSIVKRVSFTSDNSALPRVEYEDIISGHGQLNKDLYQKNSSKIGIVFNNGDILFGKLRPYLRNWLLPSFKGIAVGDFWVLRPTETNSNFIYNLIQTSKYERAANKSSGSKMPRSDWNVVSNSEFRIPHSIMEQSQIGEYFQRLDKLIATCKTEINKLKNIKKACIQKMFV